MKVIKRIEDNIPFSLHDSRIIKWECAEDYLVIYLDNVFEYTNESEKFYPASMSFEGIDLEECNVLVFNDSLEDGRFSGRKYGIKEFIKEYGDAEFEIITETYGYCSTVLDGLLWIDGCDPISSTIHIWNPGDIVFQY